MPQPNETPLSLALPGSDPTALQWLQGVVGKYRPGLWLVATITAAANGLRGFGPLSKLSLMIIGIFSASCSAILSRYCLRPGPA